MLALLVVPASAARFGAVRSPREPGCRQLVSGCPLLFSCSALRARSGSFSDPSRSCESVAAPSPSFWCRVSGLRPPRSGVTLLAIAEPLSSVVTFRPRFGWCSCGLRSAGPLCVEAVLEAALLLDGVPVSSVRVRLDGFSLVATWRPRHAGDVGSRCSVCGWRLRAGRVRAPVLSPMVFRRTSRSCRYPRRCRGGSSAPRWWRWRAFPRADRSPSHPLPGSCAVLFCDGSACRRSVPRAGSS